VALWRGVGVVAAVFIVRRVLHYATDRPSKEMLFTAVSRDDRYKTKNLIDTAVYRFGDQVGSWTYGPLGAFAVPAAVPLAVAWLIVVVALARGFDKRTTRHKEHRHDPSAEPSCKPRSPPVRSPTRVACARPPPRKLKILILGGTGFIGPALVEAARPRGHTLTLFNRGKTNPGMFKDIEQLHGDRDGQLDSLKDNKWDAVIDDSGYVPRHVRLTAELLKPSVPTYVFISTTRDCARPARNSIGEDRQSPDARDELV